MSGGLEMEPLVGVVRRTQVMVSARLPLAVPLAILVVFLAGCANGSGPGATEEPEVRSASDVAGGSLCALSMSYDGARYVSAPKGPPDRSPVLAGQTATAVLPACDDGSGQGPDSVQVDQIEGVPLDTAFWWDRTILLRTGAALPESLEALYRPPVCRFPGQVEATGQWLGVTTSKKARFDGDLRTPLRIEFYVEKADDPSADLERYTISVRDDGGARPALDKNMAEQALWSSRAALQVALVCDEGRYQAASFEIIAR